MRPVRRELSRYQMRRIKRFFGWVLWIIGALTILWLIIRIFFTSPLLDNISFSRAYYDRDGKLLRITLSADDKYRIYTPLDKISPHIKNAIVLYEDKHFYHHPGVNPIAMVRAFRQYASGAAHPVGASTITMQVARLKYDLNSKTIGGKLLQIASAIYIDLFHTKSEILEAYLNLAPYGGNIEGIGAASTIYFGRNASDLTKIESITLATVPQNPTKRGLNTPTGIANIEHMRKNLVERWIAEYPNDTNLMTLAKMPIQTRKVSDLPFCQDPSPSLLLFSKQFPGLESKIKLPFESFLFCLFLPLLWLHHPGPLPSGGRAEGGGRFCVASFPSPGSRSHVSH